MDLRWLNPSRWSGPVASFSFASLLVCLLLCLFMIKRCYPLLPTFFVSASNSPTSACSSCLECVLSVCLFAVVSVRGHPVDPCFLALFWLSGAAWGIFGVSCEIDPDWDDRTNKPQNRSSIEFGILMVELFIFFILFLFLVVAASTFEVGLNL